MIFKEIRRCKTKGALEVIPEAALDLDLAMVETIMPHSRFTIVANAGVLLVVSRDDITETTIWEDGHMLVKTLDSREAYKSAVRVFEAATGETEDAIYEDYSDIGRVNC